MVFQQLCLSQPRVQDKSQFQKRGDVTPYSDYKARTAFSKAKRLRTFVSVYKHSVQFRFFSADDSECPRTIPAGTQHQNDVVSTSMRRDHVASTLIRRHFNVVCPLG